MKLKSIFPLFFLITALLGCGERESDPFRIESVDVIVFHWSRSFDDAVSFIAQREKNKVLLTTVVSDGIGWGHPVKKKSTRELTEGEFIQIQKLIFDSSAIRDAIERKHYPVIDGSVWAISFDTGNLSIRLSAHSPSPTDSAIGRVGSLMIELSDMVFSPEKIY